MTIDYKTLESVGAVIRERFVEIETEVRRTDRGLAVVREVERLRIVESIRGLRSFVHTLTHERSRVLEERGDPPPWIASLDAERGR